MRQCSSSGTFPTARTYWIAPTQLGSAPRNVVLKHDHMMGLREQLQDITIFVSLESETFGDFDRSCDCGPQGILAPSDAWSGTSRQQHAASSCELQLASVVLTKSNESFKRQQLLNKLLLFCFSAICSVALPMISWFVYLVNCIVIMPQTLDIGSIINQLCYGFPDPTLWAC